VSCVRERERRLCTVGLAEVFLLVLFEPDESDLPPTRRWNLLRNPDLVTWCLGLLGSREGRVFVYDNAAVSLPRWSSATWELPRHGIICLSHALWELDSWDWDTESGSSSTEVRYEVPRSGSSPVWNLISLKAIKLGSISRYQDKTSDIKLKSHIQKLVWGDKILKPNDDPKPSKKIRWNPFRFLVLEKLALILRWLLKSVLLLFVIKLCFWLIQILYIPKAWNNLLKFYQYWC